MARNRFLRLFFCLAVLVFIATACNLPSSTPTQTNAPPSPKDAQPPEPSPTPNIPDDEPTYRVQFRITSTSDWTTLRLVSGANWYEMSTISASGEAKDSSIEGEQINLSQPLDNASNGQSVEMQVEATLAYLDSATPIIFEIERGNLGATVVEIFRFEEDSTSLATTLTWDGIQSGPKNAQQYQVSPLPFLGSNPNEYIVIAQLNFWYYGTGQWGGFENPDGSRSTPFTPYYGETYYASDPDWVHQQIEWAVEYGVDAFSIEWTTPRGVGCCGSMEDTLDDVFLKSPNIHKVRWVIFYDFVLRILQTGELGVEASQILNFNQPEVYDTFVEDFVNFAEKYFNHPQYLTIDDRPVIYIWATNAFTGNFSGAMQEARQKVADLGYDVFIVGDEVCVSCYNAAHAALFDGSSTFTFLIPGIDQPALDNIGEAVQTTDYAFTWWRGKISNLKVTGRDDPVVFQPAWAPQYDESWITERTTPIVVPAESREQVFDMAEVARKHAEPAGAEGLQLIWVNTWNCWGEATTIEPTIEDSPKYPVGNYGFDFLEIIREVFGIETYYTSP